MTEPLATREEIESVPAGAASLAAVDAAAEAQRSYQLISTLLFGAGAVVMLIGYMKAREARKEANNG